MVQVEQKIDRNATVAEVCNEYGSVRAFCRENGEANTRRFYRVLEGAGGSWGLSKSKKIYDLLNKEGCLRFINGQTGEGAND